VRNPYSPPETQDSLPWQNTDICVDGEYLVLRDGAVLPQRCVLTNQPVKPVDRRQRRFAWAPSFRLAVRRHRCRVSYCVNSRYRQSQQLLRILGAVAWFVLVIFAYLVVTSSLLMSAIFAVAAAWPLSRHEPLRIKHAKDGHFWFTGCSSAFLSSCETEFGKSEEPEQFEERPAPPDILKCLSCEHEIDDGQTICPKCGWTYK